MTVVVPGGKNDPDDGEHTTAGVTATASVAVAVKVTNAPPGETRLMSAGTVMTGGVVSTTLMVNVPMVSEVGEFDAVH